jgi:hypothetical protein
MTAVFVSPGHPLNDGVPTQLAVSPIVPVVIVAPDPRLTLRAHPAYAVALPVNRSATATATVRRAR